MSPVLPVERQERIASIDVLRGTAVLGILLMNIVDFGIPYAAYWNPPLWGDISGANLASWFVNQTLFEGKMRAIFSMLFGASFLVLTGRAEARGPEARAEIADIYYRRTLWLMAIGLVHALFIWWGDILFAYAIGGLFLFPLRRLSPRVLIGAGLLFLFVRTPFFAHSAWERHQDKRAGEAALALEKQGRQLTKDQEEAKKKWGKALERRKTDRRKVARKETNDHRLGYWANTKVRLDKLTETLQYLYQWLPTDTFSMMLIGMGLMKLGVFTAELPMASYLWMVVLGYGLGATVSAWAAWDRFMQNWDPAAPVAWNLLLWPFGRITVGLAHVGVVMIVCKHGWLRFITGPLAAVGQTALSNYLLTSLLCTFFFNGYGLGFFGKLERYQLLYVVAAVWTVNLVVSPIWLKHFRFGPVEWLWRSLTYWKQQPMRLPPPPAPELAVPAAA